MLVSRSSVKLLLGEGTSIRRQFQAHPTACRVVPKKSEQSAVPPVGRHRPAHRRRTQTAPSGESWPKLPRQPGEAFSSGQRPGSYQLKATPWVHWTKARQALKGRIIPGYEVYRQTCRYFAEHTHHFEVGS
jgi:hypothetical protein